MLSPKQNFLETIKRDGHPDRLCNNFSAFRLLMGDPVFKYLRGNRVRGKISCDPWGTLTAFPEDAPGPVPIVTKENQIIKDMEHWREQLTVPDLKAHCLTGWEDIRQKKAEIDTNQQLSLSFLGTGIFEQLHMLMTFEDTLCNFLMYPDEMHELVEVITEYRLTYMKLLVENLHPDAVLSHDDWGYKTGMFFSEEIWREFFKEPYRRLYSYLHENGVLVIHHADSYCEPIALDMAQIGVDVWQGVLPTNNIVKISKALDGRMALMGGVDSGIDRADATETEIRVEMRRVLTEYGTLPHFIPGLTYGSLGSIYPHVEPILIEVLAQYNQERFGLHD